MNPKTEFSIFIGIDWADKNHDFFVITGDRTQQGKLDHEIDAIEAWITQLHGLAPGQKIAIAMEQKRGAIFNALINRENVVIYPIDPGKLKSYRESYTKQAKTDEGDAWFLAKLLQERIDTLQPADNPDGLVLRISEAARLRRDAVDERTRVALKLKAELKSYFPLVLRMFGGITKPALQILKRWPTERQLKKADRTLVAKVLASCGIKNKEKQDELIRQIRHSKVFCQNAALAESHDLKIKLLVSQYRDLQKFIAKYDQRIQKLVSQHEKAHLFLGIKGVAAVTTARLLSAFEMEEPNCQSADELSARCGIVPVPHGSGKNSGKRNVSRYACNRFLKQTFHEFVERVRIWSVWTRARYNQLRAANTKHNAAIRKIARSWIRILYRMWQTGEPFDEQRYIQNCLRRNPDLAKFIKS